MKRIATAAVAATVSLTAIATPAIAAETGSSQYYKDCKVDADRFFNNKGKIEDKTDSETVKGGMEDIQKAKFGENNSSTATGVCVKKLVNNDEYKSGALALLIGVPVALVALLGAAAAFSGAIPGVQLPALPF